MRKETCQLEDARLASGFVLNCLSELGSALFLMLTWWVQAGPLWEAIACFFSFCGGLETPEREPIISQPGIIPHLYALWA